MPCRHLRVFVSHTASAAHCAFVVHDVVQRPLLQPNGAQSVRTPSGATIVEPSHVGEPGIQRLPWQKNPDEQSALVVHVVLHAVVAGSQVNGAQLVVRPDSEQEPEPLQRFAETRLLPEHVDPAPHAVVLGGYWHAVRFVPSHCRPQIGSLVDPLHCVRVPRGLPFTATQMPSVSPHASH